MIRKKIAVLRGGPSSEHEVSLKSGKNVVKELSDKYDVVDIVIDKQGVWHIHGLPVDPMKAIKTVDLVFNALHGEYGEDGKVQQLLENLQAKFTGSGSLASALAMNKIRSKEIFQKNGLKTPLHKVLSKPESDGGLEVQALLIFRHFTMPVVLKPVDKGSSIGISVANDFESLKDAMRRLYEMYPQILVEEYIVGKEATVGVIEKFRNQDLYSLLPTEIELPKQKKLFDYETKYSGTATERTPGNFNSTEREALQKIAKIAHEALGLRHYSRSDFVVHPKRGIYILETNSLPGLGENMLLVNSLKHVDLTLGDFLDHIINLS